MRQASPLRQNAEDVRRLPEQPWLGGPKAHRPHETGYEVARYKHT